jgi:hypothetical protein
MLAIAIVLELVGGLLFVLDTTLGALMLVRPLTDMLT